MTKNTKKQNMRDLTKKPDQEEAFDIQVAVNRLAQKEHREMLVRNQYDKRFSMFRTKTITAIWLSLSTLLFFAIVYGIAAITHSSPIPI